METTSPTPDAILQTAFGFWNSKVLLTAVTFDLFTTLRQRRLTGAQIGKELKLHPRSIADFLDVLVAMKFLEREGDGTDAKYFNTPATALNLDRNSPRYIGRIPEMLNARLFKYWNDLPEALRTGKPQNETKHGGKKQLAIQVTGDVAVDYYRINAMWANGENAEVRTDRLRITHTWIRTHDTWQIIGGMSAPVNAEDK